MTTFKKGDRVIVTTPNEVEMHGTIKMRNGANPLPNMYDVEFDVSAAVHTIPGKMMRLKCASPDTARAIVDKLQLIQNLRKQIDTAFTDLVGLLAYDGQEGSEQRKFEHMRIAHKTMLNSDIVAEQMAWDGYYEARKKG